MECQPSMKATEDVAAVVQVPGKTNFVTEDWL